MPLGERLRELQAGMNKYDSAMPELADMIDEKYGKEPK